MKFVLGFFLFSTLAFGYPIAPNRESTPGSYCRPSDSEYVERRYRERIPYCRRYVPPSVIETIFRHYRIPEASWVNYTIDHLIPLALGGSNARTNLWPEHKSVKALRPSLENDLYLRVHNGTLTHTVAVQRVLKAKFFPLGTDGK